MIRDEIPTLHPSVYLDEHGEEDPGLKRRRLMFLSQVDADAMLMLC